MSRVGRAYDEITGKPQTPRVIEWLHDLEERYGEANVVRAMDDVAATGKLGRFLNVVSDRLASEKAMRRASRAPHELDRETLLAMVRGQIAEPERPFIYDTNLLSRHEYMEVVAWAQNVQRGHVVGTSA